MASGLFWSLLTEPDLALLQCCFGRLFFRNIPAYRLVFDNRSGRIKDRTVAPPLPADHAVRHDDPVFDHIDRVVRGQGCEEPFHALLAFGGYPWPEAVPEEIVTVQPEIPAVCFIDKDMRPIR